MNIEELGPHSNMTVKEALGFTLRESSKYRSVIILAIRDEDEELMVRSSYQTQAEANFLIDKAKLHALGVI